MNMRQVSPSLYKELNIAADDIYRFDRVERYGILQVLDAARRNKPIDDVFIHCAEHALSEHPIKTPPIAA